MEQVKRKKKGIIIAGISAIVLIAVLGVSFAFWNYSRTTDNQVLVAGDIFMKFKEDNTLTIEDAFPREEYIPDKYFEFTVEGVNDYSKDIHYQILLSEGDAPTGDENKDRNVRIKPDLLLFKLVEVEDGEEKDIIFDRMSYPELNNTSVWVDTIKANTNTKTSKTYRLYMWISPLTKIGVGDNLDYDMDTWNNNVYGSVKVTVQGDFNEKETFSCFSGATIATYNDQRTDEQVNACVEWANEIIGPEEEVELEEGETYKSFFEGTGTLYGAPIQTWLEEERFYASDLQELSEIGIVNLKFDYSIITDYSKKCSKDVVIPRYMNKSKITTIGFDAFRGNLLTSVNIQEGVQTILAGAFSNNYLTSVNISNSVTTIGHGAFAVNNLKIVRIGNGIKFIDKGIFAYDVHGFSNVFSHHNENLESVIIDKTCEEIKNIEASSEDTTKYYPWLSNKSPYTAPGVTIYGSNGEVCDTFE